MEKLGKVMDKVIESHGVLKASKSMNPENLYSLPNIFPLFSFHLECLVVFNKSLAIYNFYLLINLH